MKKTYDALIIPTGEPTSGEGSFPVTNEAIKLFNSGKFGCVFVTGGHGGFAKRDPGKILSEAEETVEYLLEKDIAMEKIYSDDRSLETVGNFTFPLVKPLYGNPSLSDFDKMLVIGKEGHMWRIKDYAELVFDSHKNEVNFYKIPGKHNDGLLARVYHSGLMNVIGEMREAEEVHDFLMKEHPFYSKGWYEKSPLKRKLEMGATGLGWLLK